MTPTLYCVCVEGGLVPVIIRQMALPVWSHVVVGGEGGVMKMFSQRVIRGRHRVIDGISPSLTCAAIISLFVSPSA